MKSKPEAGAPVCPVGVVKRQEAPIIERAMCGGEPEYSVELKNFSDSGRVSWWNQLLGAISVLPIINLIEWSKLGK